MLTSAPRHAPSSQAMSSDDESSQHLTTWRDAASSDSDDVSESESEGEQQQQPMQVDASPPWPAELEPDWSSWSPAPHGHGDGGPDAHLDARRHAFRMLLTSDHAVAPQPRPSWDEWLEAARCVSTHRVDAPTRDAPFPPPTARQSALFEAAVELGPPGAAGWRDYNYRTNLYITPLDLFTPSDHDAPARENAAQSSRRRRQPGAAPRRPLGGGGGDGSRRRSSGMASRLVPGSFGAHVERADVLRRLLPNGSRWRSASGQLRFSLVMILHLRFLALMFRRAFLKIGPRLQRAEAERAAKVELNAAFHQQEKAAYESAPATSKESEPGFLDRIMGGVTRMMSNSRAPAETPAPTRCLPTLAKPADEPEPVPLRHHTYLEKQYLFREDRGPAPTDNRPALPEARFLAARSEKKLKGEVALVCAHHPADPPSMYTDSDAKPRIVSVSTVVGDRYESAEPMVKFVRVSDGEREETIAAELAAAAAEAAKAAAAAAAAAAEAAPADEKMEITSQMRKHADWAAARKKSGPPKRYKIGFRVAVGAKGLGGDRHMARFARLTEKRILRVGEPEELARLERLCGVMLKPEIDASLDFDFDATDDGAPLDALFEDLERMVSLMHTPTVIKALAAAGAALPEGQLPVQVWAAVKAAFLSARDDRRALSVRREGRDESVQAVANRTRIEKLCENYEKNPGERSTLKKTVGKKKATPVTTTTHALYELVDAYEAREGGPKELRIAREKMAAARDLMWRHGRVLVREAPTVHTMAVALGPRPYPDLPYNLAQMQALMSEQVVPERDRKFARMACERARQRAVDTLHAGGAPHALGMTLKQALRGGSGGGGGDRCAVYSIASQMARNDLEFEEYLRWMVAKVPGAGTISDERRRAMAAWIGKLIGWVEKADEPIEAGELDRLRTELNVVELVRLAPPPPHPPPLTPQTLISRRATPTTRTTPPSSEDSCATRCSPRTATPRSSSTASCARSRATSRRSTCSG